MNESEFPPQEYKPSKTIRGFFGILITNPYILDQISKGDTEQFVRKSVYTKKLADDEKASLIKALETTFTKVFDPDKDIDGPVPFLARNFLMAMNAPKIVDDFLKELGFGDEPNVNES